MMSCCGGDYSLICFVQLFYFKAAFVQMTSHLFPWLSSEWPDEHG